MKETRNLFTLAANSLFEVG